MIVIKPVNITDAIFTSSTIAEPDPAFIQPNLTVGEVVWTAGTRLLGEQFVNLTTHKVYEVVADPSTTDDPVGVNEGINTNPPTYLEVGGTSKYSMFDGKGNRGTTGSGTLTVAIDPDQLVNGLAAFGLSGFDAVNVTMVDPIDGTVYDRDADMNDYNQVSDWYDWFFAPLSKKEEFNFLDLPPYVDATITITATGAADFTFGELTMGAQRSLGTAVYGTGFALKDFSLYKDDGFGGINYVPRPDQKLVNFDVQIPKDRLGFAYRTLREFKGIQAAWVGSEQENDPTLIFGRYRDNNLNFTTPSLCDMTIQVKGE